jgi:hypothetical protein
MSAPLVLADDDAAVVERYLAVFAGRRPQNRQLHHASGAPPRGRNAGGGDGAPGRTASFCVATRYGGPLHRAGSGAAKQPKPPRFIDVTARRASSGVFSAYTSNAQLPQCVGTKESRCHRRRKDRKRRRT